MKITHLTSLVLLGTSLAACVTINIYFPAAAAEKAADKIIEEVWQLQKPAPERLNPGSEGQKAEKSTPAQSTQPQK